MKRIYTIIAAMTLLTVAFAQDNKPEAGKTGVGFSLTGGVSNRLVISRTLKGLRVVNTVNPSFTYTVIPFILKHADIASNIDAFIGLQVPITMTNTSKVTSSTKVTATDYMQDMSSTSTNPSSHTVGANLVLGCQWFFVKNLGIGAICGLGFSSTGSKGNIESTSTSTTTITNGSTTTTTTITSNTLSIQDNKTSRVFTFNNILGVFVTFYL